jgi:hypothetical protein
MGKREEEGRSKESKRRRGTLIVHENTIVLYGNLYHNLGLSL